MPFIAIKDLIFFVLNEIFTWLQGSFLTRNRALCWYCPTDVFEFMLAVAVDTVVILGICLCSTFLLKITIIANTT